MRICKDCRYCFPSVGTWKCLKAEYARDCVTGAVYYETCEDERRGSGTCGPDGLLYEPIETPTQKKKSLLNRILNAGWI